jgi:hypothetical protein
VYVLILNPRTLYQQLEQAEHTDNCLMKHAPCSVWFSRVISKKELHSNACLDYQIGNAVWKLRCLTDGVAGCRACVSSWNNSVVIT